MLYVPHMHILRIKLRIVQRYALMTLFFECANIIKYTSYEFVYKVYRDLILYFNIINIFNLRIIYCFNLLMIIPTLQKNTITEIIYLTLVC